MADKPDNCKIIVSTTMTKTYEVPLDAPIDGNTKIRSDIQTKGGIIEATVVSSEAGSGGAGMIFSSAFSGTYITVSYGKIKEGGESPNPLPMVTETIMGAL